MLLGELTYDEDREMLYRLEEARKSLSTINMEFLGKLEPRKEILIGDRKILLLHGSPRDPLQGYIYPDTDIKGLEIMDSFDAVFMGHTHRPFIKSTRNTLVANVGSCGLPRDCGLLPSCLIYNPDSNTAEVYRIPIAFEEIDLHYGQRVHSDVLNMFRRTSDTFVGTKPWET